MSRREDVDNAIWSDPEFYDLSPNAKLLYLWSFTNPRCGMAGIYKMPMKSAATETGLDGKTRAAFDELAAARFVYFVDGVLWVRSRVKHMRTKTTQIARAIVKDLEKIDPRHSLRGRFMAMYGLEPWLAEQLGELAENDAQKLENPISTEPLMEVPAGGSNENLQGKGTGLGKGCSSNLETAASRPRATHEPVDHNAIPADFPTELLSAVDDSLPPLQRIAAAKRGLVVTRGYVARTIMGRPLKDHVKAALDYEAWAVHGNGQGRSVKDCVAGWRNWMDREPDMAPRHDGPRPSTKAERLARGVAAIDRLKGAA
jgi:hypothetical protein